MGAAWGSSTADSAGDGWVTGGWLGAGRLGSDWLELGEAGVVEGLWNRAFSWGSGVVRRGRAGRARCSDKSDGGLDTREIRAVEATDSPEPSAEDDG